MNLYQQNFLLKFMFGRNTKTEDEYLDKCIRLAYKDMLSSGRYYVKKDINSFVCRFKYILQKDNYVFSRALIDNASKLLSDEETIFNGRDYATRYGLGQKVVNMTFKYFYIARDFLNVKINFSNCDCPLDSVILKDLGTINAWSKIDKYEYEKCQKIISNKLSKKKLTSELLSLGNLAYDFMKW